MRLGATDSQPRFEAYLWDGAEKTVTGTTIVQPGVWYHVVATAQNGGLEHLYVNGVEEGTPVLIGVQYAGCDRWRAGCAVSTGAGAGAALNGELAELGIWYSTPLTPDLVSRLANGERPATVVSTALAAPGYQLVNPTVVASGTLTQVAKGQPILQPQPYSVSPPITARYLKMCILGGSSINGNIGLNEIQVFSQVDTAVPAIRADAAIFVEWPNRGVQEILQTSPALGGQAWSSPAYSPMILDTNWGAIFLATNSAGFYRLTEP